jgi:hypothetical protein
MGYMRTFRGASNILYLDWGGDYTMVIIPNVDKWSTFVKTQQTVHLKPMHFIVSYTLIKLIFFLINPCICIAFFCYRDYSHFSPVRKR